MIIFIIFLISIIAIVMYRRGGVYINYLKNCNDEKFCGISTFDYILPHHIHSSLLDLSETKSKRVNIPGWKAGKTVSCSFMTSEIIEWYKYFANAMSKIIGEKLVITPLNLPTSCCILTYDEKDDFINWHFDVNYFNGRFFTVLIPLTQNQTCTKYVFKNKYEEDESIDMSDGTCIIFEGEKVFHMASKLCSQQKRTILSLQYTTNPKINLINRFFMSVKDFAYIPIF